MMGADDDIRCFSRDQVAHALAPHGSDELTQRAYGSSPVGCRIGRVVQGDQSCGEQQKVTGRVGAQAKAGELQTVAHRHMARWVESGQLLGQRSGHTQVAAAGP